MGYRLRFEEELLQAEYPESRRCHTETIRGRKSDSVNHSLEAVESTAASTVRSPEDAWIQQLARQDLPKPAGRSSAGKSLQTNDIMVDPLGSCGDEGSLVEILDYVKWPNQAKPEEAYVLLQGKHLTMEVVGDLRDRA
jgi:hypothetical protein